MAKSKKITKMTVKQYADHRGVKRQTVYKHIRNGKLSKSVVTLDGKMKIMPDLADQELSENLDRIHNPVRPSNELERYLAEPMEIIPAYDGPESRVEIQEQAADIASEGEEDFPGGYSHPTPIWNIRYISALWDLDPESVTVEQITKTKWRLTIADIDNEDLSPCPWRVDLSFNYDLDQMEG